jgi:hypothetical protein
MDTPRFKEVVGSFLDSSDRFQFERGELVLQIGTDVLMATATQREGTLFVKEDGVEVRAENWIAHRLAMLPLLADRILSSIKEVPAFVTPKGEFLDEISRSPVDDPIRVPDAVATVGEFLNRRPGGTCSVLYLTSDAGEGKTTVINHFARLQAKLFKERQTDWLLVPINLGGRPFLRFDDVVVASLVNQLRFQRLYFDAFLQLVRMGLIVPALDGFEEIFVETSEGDAISSLGTLIRQLKGEGSLLIAARKAYFEFRRLQTQARLLDALPDADVGFGRVGLRRWEQAEFIQYCTLIGTENPKQLYGDVTSIVGANHPLVTRPVLVRRLVEVASDMPTNSFIPNLKLSAHSYFSWLVDHLLEREANHKWIDKHGDPPKPLLTVREHHELLSFLAEEMWISRSATLSSDMVDSLAELFCESKNYSPIIARQVKERLKQHALIIAVGHGKVEFSFDHDDFREFFLGEQLGFHLINGSEADIRKIFRMENLPALALQSALESVGRAEVNINKLTTLVLRVGLSEGSSTFVRENAGAMLAPLLTKNTEKTFTIDGIVFPPQSLSGRTIVGITFKNCYFRPTTLENSELMSCRFLSCEFEHIGLVENTATVRDCSVSSDTRVHSVTRVHSTELTDFYDPTGIHTILARCGFTFERPPVSSFQGENQVDPDLRITEKALHTFTRSTLVSEGTFRLRLSLNANHFMSEILPNLMRAGVLEMGAKERYRLGISLGTIEEALANCGGSFKRFLKLVSQR